MYGTIFIGQYNISYNGFSYDKNGHKFQLVIIEKFDNNGKYIQNSKRIYYFLVDNEHNEPRFKTIEEVEKCLLHKNNSRLRNIITNTILSMEEWYNVKK